MSESLFQTAKDEEIKAGQVTDVYFARTLEILRRRGVAKRVTAEVVLKSFPSGWAWGVLAGIDEVATLLRDLPVRVRAFPEGAVFGAMQPVLTVEGRYVDFAQYETALLGLLCQASGVATKAARCKKAAGEHPVVSFGARRMHPALAPMIERNAYLGGCDGVAVVKSAELLQLEPSGTMPHSLILMLGDTVVAAQAFDEIIDPTVRRVVLIDTFGDEKVEAVRVADALRDRLYAVRLDTPASRRGDLVGILREVRWETRFARIPARAAVCERRAGRGGNPSPEPGGGCLRGGDRHQQRPGAEFRLGYRRRGRIAGREAREDVGPKGGLPLRGVRPAFRGGGAGAPPGLLRDGDGAPSPAADRGRARRAGHAGRARAPSTGIGRTHPGGPLRP